MDNKESFERISLNFRRCNDSKVLKLSPDTLLIHKNKMLVRCASGFSTFIPAVMDTIRSVTPQHIENALVHTVLHTEFNSLVVQKDRYLLQLHELPNGVLKALIGIIIKSQNDNPRASATWLPPLQNLVLKNRWNRLRNTPNKRSNKEDDTELVTVAELIGRQRIRIDPLAGVQQATARPATLRADSFTFSTVTTATIGPDEGDTPPQAHPEPSPINRPHNIPIVGRIVLSP